MEQRVNWQLIQFDFIEEWEDYFIEVISSGRGNEDTNSNYILVAEKY